MSAASVMSAPPAEHRESFPCFGSECTVIVADSVRSAAARSALDAAKQRLLQWHVQFSRFSPDSELALLNADPRETIPVSPLMRRIVEHAVAWLTRRSYSRSSRLGTRPTSTAMASDPDCCSSSAPHALLPIPALTSRGRPCARTARAEL